MQITCTLLEQAMLSHSWEKNLYLIDGFPRSFDNVEGWNLQMGSKTDLLKVLWFDAPESVLKQRILSRNENRSDDNQATLMKRFAQFEAE